MEILTEVKTLGSPDSKGAVVIAKYKDGDGGEREERHLCQTMGDLKDVYAALDMRRQCEKTA
jgi:hypothetical protein